MYPILKEVNAKKTDKGVVWKAKLVAKSSCKVNITIEAKSKDELKEIIPQIQIGAMYEVKLEPLKRNGPSLSDFVDVEVEGVEA